MPVSDGVTIWVHLHTWVDSYELYIIEEEAFKKTIELGGQGDGEPTQNQWPNVRCVELVEQ